MRFSLVLLALSSLASCGPLPHKTGAITHHHHLHEQRYLVARAETDLDSTLTTKTQKTTSTSETKKNEKSDSSTTTSDDTTSSTTTKKSSSSTTTTSSQSSSDETEGDKSSDELKKMTTLASSSDGMPTFLSGTTTSTSYSYAITVPPSEDRGSYQKNPYVTSSLAPNNVVFIAVGAVVGAVLIAAFIARFIIWCASRRRAQAEKEVYFHNFSHNLSSGSSIGSATFLLGNSSQLSILEKSSNSSHHMLDKQSVNTLNWDTTTQGRSYRDMLANMERRGSMTIGPVLELMLTSSRSNLDLPFLHAGEMDLRMLLLAPSVLDDYSELPKDTRKERPPSQFLDDLLDDSELRVTK